MLIKAADLRAIGEGRVDTAFRRWKRPTVKAGGTLLTAIGQLAIDALDAVEPDEVSNADLRRAGLAGRSALPEAPPGTAASSLYRIRLHYLGADPRLALRDELDGMESVEAALARLDARGAWTAAVMDQIAAHPGIVSQQLADALGMERQVFKTRVRRLKALGLTESLETGYRLSPRGAELLRRRSIASA